MQNDAFRFAYSCDHRRINVRADGMRPFCCTFNDTHGHDVGDKVLCDFAQIVNAQKRPTDIFARLGGEEFVLILQETDQTQAIAACNRIHSRLNAARKVELPAYTSSFGISTSDPKTTPEISAGDIITSLIKRADEAVYIAKKNGRNRIEVAIG